MADGIEAGAGLAWRLLATLEGGSLLLATSALIAYTAKARVKKHKRRRHVNSVLVTNTTNSLGKEVKQRLEACGCIVHSCSVPSDATSVSTKVDALLVIGAETRPGLEGIAELVSADVYDNLKLLETLSLLVQRGGCIAWASAGASNNAYSEATHAFDAVLRASLKYVAKKARCEAIWIDRDESVERVAESVVAALVPCDTRPLVQPYPMRNIAVQISKFFGRWLKIIT